MLNNAGDPPECICIGEPGGLLISMGCELHDPFILFSARRDQPAGFTRLLDLLEGRKD